MIAMAHVLHTTCVVSLYLLVVDGHQCAGDVQEQNRLLHYYGSHKHYYGSQKQVHQQVVARVVQARPGDTDVKDSFLKFRSYTELKSCRFRGWSSGSCMVGTIRVMSDSH